MHHPEAAARTVFGDRASASTAAREAHRTFAPISSLRPFLTQVGSQGQMLRLETLTRMCYLKELTLVCYTTLFGFIAQSSG
jgi:hypothetical protein